MKSTAEHPVHTAGIRKVSPYVAAAAIAPAFLTGSAIVHVIEPSPTHLHGRISPGRRLPAEEVDVRLLEFSQGWHLVAVASDSEVEPVFAARATRIEKHRARVRKIKGSRQLVETQADYAHLT